MKNKPRFFAFGCSYTEYCWLTWADIIAKQLSQFGWEAYNFGMSGTGNETILHSMVNADSKYNFTDNDIIMVVWSSWNRYDTYTHTWTRRGNVLNQPDFDTFLAKHWTLETDVIKNITAIESANKMFNIAFNGSIPGFEAQGFDDRTNAACIETDPLLYELDVMEMKNQFDSRKYFVQDATQEAIDHWDGHPSTASHLNYLEKVIVPQLADDISEFVEPSATVRDWAMQRHRDSGSLIINTKSESEWQNNMQLMTQYKKQWSPGYPQFELIWGTEYNHNLNDPISSSGVVVEYFRQFKSRRCNR